MFFEPVVADWARIMSGMSWLTFPRLSTISRRLPLDLGYSLADIASLQTSVDVISPVLGSI